METCVDLVCICGNHECAHKFQRDAIKPLVYKPGLPESETHDKYRGYTYEPPTKSLKPFSLKWKDDIGELDYTANDSCHFHERDGKYTYEPHGMHLGSHCFKRITDVNEPNYKLKHPTHTHQAREFCYEHQKCCNCECSKPTCGHGPYIPKSSLKKPVCHPDRPNNVGVTEVIELENKECSKCSEIFDPINRSLWEEHKPPKGKEEFLEECHDLCAKSPCEHNAEIEGCCCRCCTCRGCPSCSTEFCHPCSFTYGRAGLVNNCRTTDKSFLRNDETGQACEKHPSGCYFVPKINA